MSITPIGSESDGSTEEQPADPAPSGVWERLRAACRWLRDKVPPLRARVGTTERKRNDTSTDAETPRLPAREGTLVAGVAPRKTSPNGSVARPSTPGERSDVETERDGDSVRVYDPDEPEAYVVSDEWTPVER